MSDQENEQKWCRGCKVFKSTADFRKHTTSRDLLTTRCRECLSSQNKEYYERNLEKRRQYDRELRVRPSKEEAENRRRKKAEYHKEWLSNPETRERVTKYKRLWHLCRTYDITPEQYEAKEEAQKGICKICERQVVVGGGNSKGFHLDHNHSTGQVRDLLCLNCNHMLGNAVDDPEILRKGAAYLDHHNALWAQLQESKKSA